MTSVKQELAQLRTQSVGAAFGLGWASLKSLPAPVARRGFELAADLATRRDGPRIRQLRRNLRRVVGPDLPEQALTELVGRSMRSYARYWLETFRLPAMDKRVVVERAGQATIGTDELDAAKAAGRGCILALPHMGNWDVAGLWLIQRYGAGFTTVAERLEPASLFDRFVAYRESLGMEVLPLTGGQSAPTAVLTERLRAGGIVCLVADRDLSHRGVTVDFFGETAKMPPGPALLAAMTGAALLPVGLWFTEQGWGQSIGAPIELAAEGRLADRVRAATQVLADRFAEQIAAHPTDWHMPQKFWLADLDPARS